MAQPDGSRTCSDVRMEDCSAGWTPMVVDRTPGDNTIVSLCLHQPVGYWRPECGAEASCELDAPCTSNNDCESAWCSKFAVLDGLGAVGICISYPDDYPGDHCSALASNLDWVANSGGDPIWLCHP